jgi:tetratricopeptide (TPR) repeat protein
MRPILLSFALAVAARAVLLAAPVAVHAQGKPSTIAELEVAARADSNDPVAHFNLATALVKSRRYHDAEQSLRIAVRIDPQYAPALLLLAQVNESQANGPIGAVVIDRQILFFKVDPHANETARLRRRAFLIEPLLEIAPPSRDLLPTTWRGTLGQALYNYDRERWPDAIAGFQTVIDRTTRSNDSTKVPPVALWFRARCALRVGDYDAAIHYFTWLLALPTDSTLMGRVWNPFVREELRYVLAYVHQQAGRWDEALRGYQDLVAENLGLDAAHTHIAEIYEAQGDWANAVEERKRAIYANPEVASLVFNLGSTLTSAGRYAEAAAALEPYAVAYPRESRVFYLLGVARQGLRQPDAAREALTRYLALAPSRYAEQIADAKQRLAKLPT